MVKGDSMIGLQIATGLTLWAIAEVYKRLLDIDDEV